MYDCWKPTLPRPCIIAGRVNASASQITSGMVERDVADQPFPEFHRLGVRVVDRKIFTPWSIQTCTTRRISA